MLKHAVALAATVAFASQAFAQVSETQAKLAAQELRLLVTEGTGVINDLQPEINAGTLQKEFAQIDALLGKLQARYSKVAGAPIDTKEAGLVGDIRRAYIQAYKDTLTKKQAAMSKGGQDALVPAHFRALVLKDFNKAMAGRINAYATNRDSELINSDWSVKNVMRHSPLLSEAKALVDTGSQEPTLKRFDKNYMGYWPMKLQAACVACHAQNGLKQQVGQFGGALIADVPMQ